MNAIVLAGGLGTRLRSVINDMPKPMADIKGKPFLAYLLDYLSVQGVSKVVLSVGYKYEVIKEYFGDCYKKIKLLYSIEEEPLGTGGAIKKSLYLLKCSEPVIVINGDTFFNVTLGDLVNFFIKKSADAVIALKKMENYDRYGSVNLDSQNKIIGFEEKNYKEIGYINGGIYVIHPNIFDDNELNNKFSFEKDFLEKFYNQKLFYGLVYEDYFIDIGIPEDYRKAQEEISLIIK